MPVVLWTDIRVRLRIAAENETDLENALADIERKIVLAARRKVLRERYHLLGHVETYGTARHPLSRQEIGRTIRGHD